MPGRGFATRAIHAGLEADPHTGAIIPPVTLATTYKKDYGHELEGYCYTRLDNPNRSNFETAVAALEGASHAAAFSSGMAVVAAVLSMLEAGSHIVTSDGCYGGTYTSFSKIATKHNIDVTFADLRDPESLRTHMQPNTKLVWIETPTNPTLRLVDIAAAAKISHEHDAILVVDNTFMTPYFQSPLELGADIVSYSVTKYLNGHSDVLMGVALTNSKRYYDELTQAQGVLGGVPSPFDLFLARRGLMTLEVRMQRHETNANALAKYLESRLGDAIDEVIYTGLPSHPQHELAKRQQRGFGAVISIRLKKKEDDCDPVKVFINNLQIAENATSLGGTETTVSVPHQTGSHAMLPEDLCRSLGVDGYLVRISVGIETLDDLIEDFGQALDKAYA